VRRSVSTSRTAMMIRPAKITPASFDDLGHLAAIG
jgi:hypothetical protein